MPRFDQMFQRVLVEWFAKTLVYHLTIPLESICLEGAENIVGVRLTAARLIDIFHADQPLAVTRTRVKVTPHGGHKRTQMQRPGGGRSKPPNILTLLQTFSGLRGDEACVSFQPSQSGAR